MDKKIYTLGWVYGRLEAALGDDYDKNGGKLRRAAMQPWLGFTTITKDAISSGKMVGNLKSEIVFASEALSPGDITMSPLPVEKQAEWNFGYYAGKSGRPLESN